MQMSVEDHAGGGHSISKRRETGRPRTEGGFRTTVSQPGALLTPWAGLVFAEEGRLS